MSEHENSILEPLDSEMRCGVFTNSKGDVLIIHDQDMHSSIQWTEYDEHDNIFSLIHEYGKIQCLGLEIDKKMKSNLKQAKEVSIAKIVNGEVQDVQKITLLVK